MVSVQKVDASMFDQVYPLLREHDPSLDAAIWQRLFNYQWSHEEGYCGYGLFDHNRIVGYLGLIFSQRSIEGKVERFCNISTWVVQEGYRGHSLSLILPAIKLHDYTLTDLSPFKEAAELAIRLGFKELDLKLKLLLPFPFFFQRSQLNGFQFSHNPSLIQAVLVDEDSRLFLDHQPYSNCKHLIIFNELSNTQYCYLIFTVFKNNGFSYCHIHYISHIYIFIDYNLAIRVQIARQHKVNFIIVDSRFVACSELPMSWELPFNNIKLYKSETLSIQNIDNLYSELVLLNLNTLPQTIGDFWHRLRERYHQSAWARL
jgi:hypothetical protein